MREEIEKKLIEINKLVEDNYFIELPTIKSEDFPNYDDPCAGCSNNPKNNPNASGFCGCTLPYLRRTY